MANTIDSMIERITYLKDRLAVFGQPKVNYHEVIPEGNDLYTWISSQLHSFDGGVYFFGITKEEGCRMVTDEVDILFAGSRFPRDMGNPRVNRAVEKLHELSCIQDINGAQYYITGHGSKLVSFGIHNSKEALQPEIYHERRSRSIVMDNKVLEIQYKMVLAPKVEVWTKFSLGDSKRQSLQPYPAHQELELANKHLTELENWFNRVVKLRI